MCIYRGLDVEGCVVGSWREHVHVACVGCVHDVGSFAKCKVVPRRKSVRARREGIEAAEEEDIPIQTNKTKQTNRPLSKAEKRIRLD